jgi:uncharacterized protein YjbJ (UPF0337 family)
MGLQDKIANKVQVLKGKAKEATGRVTHDPGLEVEGRLDQGKGTLRQAGEKLKDAGRRVFGSRRRGRGNVVRRSRRGDVRP